ncbi:hypothetical protein BAUCODRAFT_25065 [Baudoinia panamericana UAMH 10762]|uniref:Uncharacterized protein n=1 Tax=Baudoinia panamericana (strain UAMH 10762) TaxID=717646 RepID=M2MTP5_BAUPA|nr:uncharacterized protein BAUCODRAFT_25065 [Baudoinia panamericana UAMH 10762]EMC94908.1 hypothetical protein BAUCODRAFT_25065 [Baudoinia panamericana UAMH 10762]
MPPYWNPCSYLPRRLQIVASLTTFILLCFLFLGSTSREDTDPYLDKVPFGSQIQQGAHQVVDNLPKLPNVNTPQWLNPFRAPAHTPPPEQANSSSGEARWYTDFKWRNPFSSSVTLDEQRAVLPPLPDRPPVYTYYDPGAGRKDEHMKQTEQDLLQIWRRAWWAQGFKPVVLGRPEAMNNPLFRQVQGLQLEPELDLEMMRWLAWGNMGSGILSNWLAVPMAPFDDPLLTFLRRGEYPELTRYEGLENGIFIGSRDAIDSAIKAAIAEPTIKTKKSVVEALPGKAFRIDSNNGGIAFYSTGTIKEKYSAISAKLSNPSLIGEGLAMLTELINSHLHTIWQNTFSSGIAVLKPLPEHSTAMIEPALDLARNLTQCAASPIPASCPPNRPRCKPCVSDRMQIHTPPVFRNTSTLFTIATVPHPYTMTSLLHERDDLSVRFVRRETARDQWITAATKELLGTGLSSFSRLVSVKDAVASDYGAAHSLWLTAERPPDKTSEKDLEELDFIFGFTLPRTPTEDGKSEDPVPRPNREKPPSLPPTDFGEGMVLSGPQLEKERSLLERAKMLLRRAGSTRQIVGKQSSNPAARMRGVVEAWNLADTEAWKFVRAFNARRRLERRKWEEDEDDFLGKGTWDRWVDKII